jgi:hypothetical protein
MPQASLAQSSVDSGDGFDEQACFVDGCGHCVRALTWDHVDLVGIPDALPPVPPSVRVWRSVRAGGDTKTRLSRRTLALPSYAVESLSKHQARLAELGLYDERGLVFCSAKGTALDAASVRRMFRSICAAAGLEAGGGRRASCGTLSSR